MEGVWGYRMSIIIRSFSKGQNRQYPEGLELSECSKLQNYLHTEGYLRSMDGRVLYNPDEILADTPVKSVYRWNKTGHAVNNYAATTQQGFTLARCGEYVWLNCEITAAATGTVGQGYITVSASAAQHLPSSGTLIVQATTPYTLAYTAKDETTGRLTCTVPAAWVNGNVLMRSFRPILKTTGNTDAVDFAEMNGRLYIAADSLYRFDGFYYHVGKAACSATGVVTPTNATWTSVKPGDKMYFKVAGSWLGPYTVGRSAPDFRLQTNGPDTGGAVDYIIARVNSGGMAPPVSIPVGTPVAGGLTGALAAGSYCYKFTLKDEDGNESATASPAVTTVVASLGQHVTVTITPQLNWWIGDNIESVVIYRTEVNPGATPADTAYKLLAEVELNGSDTVIYEDLLADAALGALLSARTTDTGVPIPYVAQVNTVGAAASSNLSAGTYKYAASLYNPVTDDESNISSESLAVTITAGQYATVALDLTECDRQAVYVNFYRTAANGSILKYAGRVRWLWPDTSVTFTDNTITDANLGDLAPDAHDIPPTGITDLLVANGSMCCWGDDELFWWSTTGRPGYFPPYEHGIHDIVVLQQRKDSTLGGFVRCGNRRILAAVIDAGAYSTNATTGSSVLIKSRNRSFTWRGTSWYDHQLNDAASPGTVSSKCLVNCDGIIIDLGITGPVVKPVGALTSEKGNDNLFPTIRYPFATEVTAGAGTNDYFSQSSACYWRDFYVFTYCASPSTIPNKLILLHIPTGTFCELGTSTYPVKAACLSSWNDEGDNGELMYGDAVEGYIWQLHAKTGAYTYWTPSTSTGVECIYRSGMLSDPVAKDRIWDNIQSKELQLYVDKPASNQSITPKIYANGDESTVKWTGAAKVLDSTATGGRLYPSIETQRSTGSVTGGAKTRAFMIELLGTFTRTVVIHGIKLETDSQGR
jgi:hypothetical protein